jgi:hypothetical protein
VDPAKARKTQSRDVAESSGRVRNRPDDHLWSIAASAHLAASDGGADITSRLSHQRQPSKSRTPFFASRRPSKSREWGTSSRLHRCHAPLPTLRIGRKGDPETPTVVLTRRLTTLRNATRLADSFRRAMSREVGPSQSETGCDKPER